MAVWHAMQGMKHRHQGQRERARRELCLSFTMSVGALVVFLVYLSLAVGVFFYHSCPSPEVLISSNSQSEQETYVPENDESTSRKSFNQFIDANNERAMQPVSGNHQIHEEWSRQDGLENPGTTPTWTSTMVAPQGGEGRDLLSSTSISHKQWLTMVNGQLEYDNDHTDALEGHRLKGTPKTVGEGENGLKTPLTNYDDDIEADSAQTTIASPENMTLQDAFVNEEAKTSVMALVDVAEVQRPWHCMVYDSRGNVLTVCGPWNTVDSVPSQYHLWYWRY